MCYSQQGVYQVKFDILSHVKRENEIHHYFTLILFSINLKIKLNKVPRLSMSQDDNTFQDKHQLYFRFLDHRKG